MGGTSRPHFLLDRSSWGHKWYPGHKALRHTQLMGSPDRQKRLKQAKISSGVAKIQGKLSGGGYHQTQILAR